MNSDLITPIILAGGKGTRLWPMSRSSRPKQFLPLTGDLSLFQQTLLRLDDKTYSAPIIITNEDYRFLVAEQALEIGVDLEAILLEPCVRNTAPAIVAACLVASKENKNQIVHILASDHDILVDEAYLNAINRAKTSAQEGRLVTFGITPTEPATGFGYIEAGEAEQGGGAGVGSVATNGGIKQRSDGGAGVGSVATNGGIKQRSDGDAGVGNSLSGASERSATNGGIKQKGGGAGEGSARADGDKYKGGAYSIKKFVEKPNLEKAKQMLASGKHYWNSGMFMFLCSKFLDESKKLSPKVFTAASASVKKSKKNLDFIRLDANEFASSPNISIDYAIFKKTKLASVVPSPIIWSDLGSWDAVWKVGNKDENGNLQRGLVDLNDTKNSLIMSEKLHISVDGLDDVAIIVSEDAIYVGNLSKAQNVGDVVKKLSANPKTASLTEMHQTTYRPWGGYSSVLNGERFQVKRLFVKAGKKLSLQKHQYRSEHWVVVHGTAEVQIDDKTMTLSENESVYIPQGAVHRLHNPGKILLELIEVQTGSYLGEDDIIRIEDEYGRT